MACSVDAERNSLRERLTASRGGDGAEAVRVNAKLGRASAQLRFEDAARLRDRIDALEEISVELARLQRLRELTVCLVVPAADGGRRAFYVAKGQVVCTRPYTGPAGLEWEAALSRIRQASPTLSPEAADDLMVVAAFLRRPGPELEVVALPTLAVDERAA